MYEAVVRAIQMGDVDTLQQLLAAEPGLARVRFDGKRTWLHVATDWPGHFPNVRETIDVLVVHGADVNAKAVGMQHTETPLHWAASSDDVVALEALLDQGADMEATGGVIGGGTALADAVAFATWRAARRLVERGAETTIWQAAALGLLERVEAHCGANPAPTAEAITNAFWGACHGGQLLTAQFLHALGADLHWVGHDRLTPLAAAKRNGNEEVVRWLRSVGAA